MAILVIREIKEKPLFSTKLPIRDGSLIRLSSHTAPKYIFKKLKCTQLHPSHTRLPKSHITQTKREKQIQLSTLTQVIFELDLQIYIFFPREEKKMKNTG